jgi:hypothetical protein
MEAEGIGGQPTPLLQYSPLFGGIVCKAAMKYVRKRVGSLSPSSKDSQATGPPTTSYPFADQRGFAKAGWSRDEVS